MGTNKDGAKNDSYSTTLYSVLRLSPPALGNHSIAKGSSWERLPEKPIKDVVSDTYVSLILFYLAEVSLTCCLNPSFPLSTQIRQTIAFHKSCICTWGEAFLLPSC